MCLALAAAPRSPLSACPCTPQNLGPQSLVKRAFDHLRGFAAVHMRLVDHESSELRLQALERARHHLLEYAKLAEQVGAGVQGAGGQPSWPLSSAHGRARPGQGGWGMGGALCSPHVILLQMRGEGSHVAQRAGGP